MKRRVFFFLELRVKLKKITKIEKKAKQNYTNNYKKNVGTLEFLKKYGKFLNFEAQLTQVSEQRSF